MSDEDDLYGLPLDEFVAARDALAKRVGGEQGAAIRALRKPSVSAWAANQAVRSQPRAARELWAAGDALLEAHAAIVAGRKADLRAATARHRAAVRPLVAAATGLLDHRGRGPSIATLQRVEATLHAASLEPQLRAEAVAGRLTTDHRHVGAV